MSVGSMNNIELDIHGVFQYLPHRYPFLLIDRVLSYEPKKSLVALKNVTVNEEFFNGHFPKRPVMPGVLILEALAQATGILTFKAHNTYPDEKSLYFLAGVDKARFKRVVEPGDQLYLEVELLRNKGDIWKFNGTAKVAGAVVCSAEFTSAKKDIE